MAAYLVSGVWKDTDGVITHYSFHTHNQQDKSYGPLTKKTKAEAIRLLETAGNSAVTMTWNYSGASWNLGETVTVVGSGTSKYLRSNPDSRLTDNLGHLIQWNDIVV